MGDYKCLCSPGYKLDSKNHGQCIAEDGNRLLLVTLIGGRRLMIDLTNGSSHSIGPNEVLETITKIDVDLHHTPQVLFFKIIIYCVECCIFQNVACLKFEPVLSITFLLISVK